MSVITVNIDQTVSAFLNKYQTDLDAKLFLNIQWGTVEVQTNWDKIKRKYKDEDEISDNESKYDSGNFNEVLIKSGTPVLISGLFLKRSYFKLPQFTYQATDYKPFITEQLKQLFYDPRYEKYVDSYSGERLASIVSNEVTVYIWCRAIKEWVDVSDFVISLNTKVDGQVGTFSMVMPQVSCEYDGVRWNINNDSVYQNNVLIKNSTINRGGYDRQNSFFHTVIQENDLVFIKFERLSSEARKNLGEVNPTRFIWDMIGLVDGSSISTFSDNVNITVYGRDLLKTWIEDGSYFFVSSLAQQIFADEDSILAKRNLLEGLSIPLAGYAVSFKPIDLMLKFIYNKFSNLGLVPNEAFNVYGNRAIKSKYQLRSSSSAKAGNDIIDELNNDFLDQERQGVYRIIELLFDASVVNRILADSGIVHDNGSIINTVRKFCQMPFVEFYGDTYEDKFTFIVRKPPFDEEGYKGMIYDNFLTENSKPNGYDPNSNSLLKKDGFGVDDDKLKESIRLKIKRDQASFNGRSSAISNLVIDIDDVDVIGEPQLFYHAEAYSWYRVIPNGYNLINEVSEFRLAPAVSFDEYAEIWGNKPCEIEYNYLPSDFVQDSEVQGNLGFAENQIFLDLQFLIQSNQYLPFARKGTIVLTGDRRIKRGLFVYLKSTKEIFYVDSVTNVRDVSGGKNNRATILQVSRGLREPYIKGKLINFVGKSELVSYFNIINTDIQSNANVNNTAFLKNWRVNKNVFDFFVGRRQWAE